MYEGEEHVHGVGFFFFLLDKVGVVECAVVREYEIICSDVMEY